LNVRYCEGGYAKTGNWKNNKRTPQLAAPNIESTGAMSPIGTSRHFAAMQHFGRSRSEADIDGQAKPAEAVENDPRRTFAQIIVVHL
jgi:hypothetical protein